MTRCVLRYPRVAEAPPGDLDRIAEDGDVTILDRAAPGLALIELPEEALPRLRAMLPGWRIQYEATGTLPRDPSKPN